MKTKKQQIQALNAAFLSVSRELKRYRKTCAANGSPLLSVTFRVLADGNTKLHVVYQRKPRE